MMTARLLAALAFTANLLLGCAPTVIHVVVTATPQPPVFVTNTITPAPGPTVEPTAAGDATPTQETVPTTGWQNPHTQLPHYSYIGIENFELRPRAGQVDSVTADGHIFSFPAGFRPYIEPRNGSPPPFVYPKHDEGGCWLFENDWRSGRFGFAVDGIYAYANTRYIIEIRYRIRAPFTPPVDIAGHIHNTSGKMTPLRAQQLDSSGEAIWVIETDYHSPTFSLTVYFETMWQLSGRKFDLCRIALRTAPPGYGEDALIRFD